MGWEDCFCPRTYNLRAKGTQITVVAVNGGRDRTGPGQVIYHANSCTVGFMLSCNFFVLGNMIRPMPGGGWIVRVRVVRGTGCWDCNAANCCCDDDKVIKRQWEEQKQKQKPALNCTNCNLILRLVWQPEIRVQQQTHNGQHRRPGS